MDRRSWLWRRKSSDKSPNGETESSGSMSSHSERFSDDQVSSNQNTHSPEVVSKAAPSDEELGESVKTLSEKLSEALLNIRAKDDLVKQHAKVAEEAVSGWERAENEVLILKKQNEALTQKNSVLEEHVGHLDGALKECLRQLRQAREEQEENAKTDVTKLEMIEKENATLKLELQSQAEELKLMTRERDLSTHTAEAASKQHLDSIKKIAKLEAECRTLKAVARKASSPANEINLLATEDENCKSNGFEQVKRAVGRNNMVSSVEIDLMDDFLEMERLAALPEKEGGGSHPEKPSKAEFDTMISQIAELEEKLEKVETEKLDLEMALTKCQKQLKTSRDQLKDTKSKLVDVETQLITVNEAKRAAEVQVEAANEKLTKSTKRLEEAKSNLVELQNRLTVANEEKGVLENELKASNVKKQEVELQAKSLELSISTLEEEAMKERAVSSEAVAKCQTLENEISRMKLDFQLQRSSVIEEFRVNQDNELAVAASKFTECQKTIDSLSRQLKSLATLDDFLIDSDGPI